jgi:signal peptidase I
MQYTLETHEASKLGLAAEMLCGHGIVRLELKGTSMLPSLWPADLLTVECVAHDEITPGDIVLISRDNRFFTHRLIGRRQDQGRILWITRGDAVPQNDPPVAASELLGRVVGVRRGNRIFVPTRRLSPLQSALAWMLCRLDHFRGLALRIHAARLQAGPTRSRQFLRDVFAEASTNRGRSLITARDE